MTPPDRSIESLVSEHGPYLQRLARALVGDLHRAEDLVSETWAVALAASEGPSGMTEPRGWLATVMRRRARHGFRREALRRTEGLSAASGVAESGGGSGDIAMRLERERLLHGALEKLDEPYRGVLYLRYREGLAPRKIAARTGSPVKTIHTQVSRGLEKLRGDLARAHQGIDDDRRAWLSAIGPLALPRSAGSAVAARTAWVAAVTVGALGLSAWAMTTRGPVGAEMAAGSGLAVIGLDPVATATQPVESEPGAVGASEARLTIAGTAAASTAGVEITALAASGAPLAGETLMLATRDWHRAQPRGLFTATTDATGKATFDWPGTNHFVCFNAARTLVGESDFPREAADVQGDEALAYSFQVEPGLRVAGVVRDALGAAVPGASVFAAGDPEDDVSGPPIATCDVTGSFDVAVSAEVRIYAAADGRTCSSSLEVDRLPESTPGLREVQLTLLADGALVSGSVTNTQGEPVPGAWIVAQPLRTGVGPDEGGRLRPLSTVSDGEGRYVLPGKLRPREYELCAYTSGYAPRVLPLEAGTEPVTLDFTLAVGATVRGRVLVDPETAVASSYVVYKVPGERGDRDPHGPGHSTNTDEAGRFELCNVPAGAYVFSAHGGPSMGRARARAEQVIPESGTVDLDLTLSFEPRISGRVVDEAGLPIEGLFVEAELGGMLHYEYQVRTNEDGRFELTALPDAPWHAAEGASWSLHFMKASMAPGPALAKVENVAPGTTDIEVEVTQAVEVDSYLTGRFVRSDGPISDAVDIYVAQSDGDGALGNVEVDPVSGSFTYGPMTPGIYEFFVSDPNKNSVGLLGIEVGEGETLDLGDIDMARGGQVALSLDFVLPAGVPASAAEELNRDHGLILLGPGGHKVWLRFDESGYKTAGPIEPGEWKLWHRTGSRVVLPATTFTVLPKEVKTAEVEARVGRPLVASVLMPTDGSWETAAIRIYGADAVELETSEALPPSDMDAEERLKLVVDAPIESIRAVLVIDGAETEHVVEVTVPFFTEPFSGIEIDAR